jgi:hypothetical protein
MTTPARTRVIVHVSIPKVPAAPPEVADAADAADDGPVCGWFESSWALRQGLAVQELGPGELADDGTVAALWLAALATPAAESARWQ